MQLNPLPERGPAASSSHQFGPWRSDIGPKFTFHDPVTGRWFPTREAANTSGEQGLPAATDMSTDAAMPGGVWTQESPERQSFYPIADHASSNCS